MLAVVLISFIIFMLFGGRTNYWYLRKMTLEEQRNIIATFSEMAPRYEGLMNNELNRFWGINYEGFVAQLLESVKTRPDEVILDIATGTAFIPSYLSRSGKKFKKIIGIDITLSMLQNANRNLGFKKVEWLTLVCGSAHELPLKAGSVDRAICCLATHHMDAERLLSNIFNALKDGGTAHLADAGSSNSWKNGLIRFGIKSLAFLYFLFTENYTRAVAEAQSIANIHTIQQWEDMIVAAGFSHLELNEMKSKKFWAPNPIILKFQKREDE